ncbi:MAG: hypothetical protein ACKOAD_08165 [Gammaproteobacteria bacterium]
MPRLSVFSYRFKWWLIYLFSIGLGIVLIMSNLGSVLNMDLPPQERWVPLEQDSFFHARRILDTAKDPSHFYEFDPKIQAPEGAWLVYPWFYDYTMGLILKGFIFVFPEVNPIEIMNYLPMGLFLINSMIFLALTGTLELKLGLRFLALLCFTLLPINTGLHMVGRLDHHGAEYTFVLLSLWLGMEFLKRPEKKWATIGLAWSLVFALGIQPGLILLQFLFLGTLFLEWILNKKLNKKYDFKLFMIHFFIANLALLLPAEPFRKFMFSLYLLGWFQALMALITAFVFFYMKTHIFNIKNLSKLILFCLILSMPAWPELKLGADFIFNRIDYLKNTSEMQPPGGFSYKSYTVLFWIFPFSLLPLLAWCLLKGGIWRYYFLIRIVFGSFLLLMQQRFHYHANFALFLPIIFVLDFLSTKPIQFKYKAWVYWGLILSLVGVYVYAIPSWRYIAKMPEQGQAREKSLLGSAWDYQLGFYLLNRLKAECLKDPGLVLADPHIGNYIRFHTECSVLSTRMLIAPQDIEKALRTQALFDGSQEDFLKASEPIKYVFASGLTGMGESGFNIQLNNNNGLQAQLIFGQPYEWDKNFQLLAEQHVNFENMQSPQKIVWGRLFKIRKKF